MSSDTKATLHYIAMLTAAFLVMAAFAIVYAHMEAKTYTKLTGKEVTTWDALWVDLRVQEEPK